MNTRGRARGIIAILLCCALACCIAVLSGCGGSGSKSKNSASTSQSSQQSSSSSSKSKNKSGTDSNSKPKYEDARWPTTNSQLLAIPESKRWYNASPAIDGGTRCTIAGPVVNSYQANESQGQPIYLDIGESYPSEDCVSVLIWASDVDNGFRDMLDDVYGHSNCWISVTGYLSVYNGHMQFKSNDGMEFQWWTNVK